MVYFVRSQVAAQVEQRPFCKESLRMLRNHPGANHVFGKGFDVKVSEKSQKSMPRSFDEILVFDF